MASVVLWKQINNGPNKDRSVVKKTDDVNKNPKDQPSFTASSEEAMITKKRLNSNNPRPNIRDSWVKLDKKGRNEERELFSKARLNNMVRFSELKQKKSDEMYDLNQGGLKLPPNANEVMKNAAADAIKLIMVPTITVQDVKRERRLSKKFVASYSSVEAPQAYYGPRLHLYKKFKLPPMC